MNILYYFKYNLTACFIFTFSVYLVGKFVLIYLCVTLLEKPLKGFYESRAKHHNLQLKTSQQCEVFNLYLTFRLYLLLQPSQLFVYLFQVLNLA